MSTRAEPTDLSHIVSSDACVAVRRRVIRQLTEALLYEGIVAPRIAEERDGLTFTLAGADAQGAPVAYLCRGRRRPSFGRIRLTDPVVTRVSGGRAEEVTSPAQFLIELALEQTIDPARLAQFIGEIDQTLIKDAQAQVFACADPRPLRGRPYADVESALCDGHPYHPTYKSRIGFDLADNRRFGPEFGPTLQPLWVATHRSHTRTRASAHLDVPTFLRAELGEEVLAGWRRTLERGGRSAADYNLLPVHPWQWERQLAPSLFQDGRDGLLVPLGPAPDLYRPQQSIRTLANFTDPRKASLKQALSIVNTSTARILAPHTVENAAIISDWLANTVAADPFLAGEARPIFLRELLGVAYESPRPALLRDGTYGALSCVWRESLEQHLEPGEAGLPWAALTSIDRDGRPIIDDWVQASSAEVFTRRLLAVSVLPVLHVLVAHGIGLESHAQNMILVHRDGVPVRVALKDFHDGVRFSPAHLARPESAPALCPTPEHHVRVNRNSFVTTDAPTAVRDFVLDAFLHINLGELALFMAERYRLSENWFWSATRELLTAHRQRFSRLAPRFALFELAGPSIAIERLTQRRFFGETGVTEQAAPNPLAGLF